MAKTISNKELDTVVNYMILSFGYNACVILPYKEGAAVIAAMEHAENLKSYYAHEGIKFSDTTFELTNHTIPQKDYRESKMNHLLGVDSDGNQIKTDA
jgi:hypothetical protein